ncbi:hypothetical protein [Jiangella endophytica]|uniref:hypothetical protein n=1 Tax=Jiangella endophytica TaxID=1623398 RepID=UPI00130076C8|nr:hypothetical protein [Jiangella endophytica]
MAAVDDAEGLSPAEGVAAAGASFLALVLTVLAFLLLSGGADLVNWLLVVLLYATPIWLAGFLVVGLPVAVWIENRTPVSAPARGRYMRYAKAGMVVGAVLFLVHPFFLPVTVAAAVGGRAGVELRRRRDRRPRGQGGGTEGPGSPPGRQPLRQPVPRAVQQSADDIA